MQAGPTSSLPALPRGLAALAGCALLMVAGFYAFHIVFSRSLSQDEGYLMITIQSFLEGHALYDTVFTQYGPFYYFYEWIARGLLGVPLTHDATRLLCLVHWLTASALLGLAARIILRSGLGGALVFMQAVLHLANVANEPGHPQELVVVLLALGVLVSTRVSGTDPNQLRHLPLSLLLVILAVLVFTKINVGIFFGLALGLALRCRAKDCFSGPGWTGLLAMACAGLPLLLMRRHLDAEWCRNSSLIAAATVAATFVLAQGLSAKQEFSLARYARMAAFFFLPSALFLALSFWTGTSGRGLLEGLVLTPLKMPGVALLPLPISSGAVLNALISLLCALAVRFRPAEVRLSKVLVSLKSCYGIAGMLWFLDDAKGQFVWLLPWVWLVLVPAGPVGSRPSFARVFLALAAAWQGLQAYPIAGTQVTTATFLLPLAFTLCLRDVVQAACKWNGFRDLGEQFVRLAPGRRWLAQALGCVVLLYVFANLGCHLGDVRREYASLPPLQLPGSRLVHMDAETGAMYRELSAYLEKECDTFVTYPGINSLYFWTGKRPPTHLNSTGWGQLSHEQQAHILGGLRHARRPLLVVVAAAAQSWSQGAPPPIRPLVQCVTEDCQEVKRIGRFILFIPTRAGQTALRNADL